MFRVLIKWPTRGLFTPKRDVDNAEFVTCPDEGHYIDFSMRIEMGSNPDTYVGCTFHLFEDGGLQLALTMHL